MSENKMAEVAKLLGLELNEEFGLKNSNFRYKLTTYGLRKRHITIEEWSDSCMLDDLLLGKCEIVKKDNSILDESEKRYLSNVIKPFRNQVTSISKKLGDYGEFIDIEIKEDEYSDGIYLPYFKPNSMYKGMVEYNNYTLEELGL